MNDSWLESWWENAGGCWSILLFPVLGLRSLACCFLVTRDMISQVFESSSFQGLCSRRANFCRSGWDVAACLVTEAGEAGLSCWPPDIADHGGPTLAGEPDATDCNYNPTRSVEVAPASGSAFSDLSSDNGLLTSPPISPGPSPDSCSWAV